MKMKRALVILQNYGGSMKKFKINVQRCGCVLLFSVLFIIILSVSALAEENQSKVVRVGWYEGTYNMTDPNGQRSGYSYEYQQTVAAYTGWTYEYVTADWSELLKMLQDGKIDLMGGVSYTEERTDTMLFSELPMGKEKYYLYADLSNTNLSTSDLTTLNGKRIGMLEESFATAQYCAWEEKHGLRTQQNRWFCFK